MPISVANPNQCSKVGRASSSLLGATLIAPIAARQLKA
jgi:hypothetical protein